MRGTITLLVLAAVLAITGCGGGSGEGELSPREQGMQNTNHGSYQVKATEDGRVQGVGIYDNGSFRILMENMPRAVIHDEESGENWLIDLRQKTYEPISYDEALMKAGFLPNMVTRAYFDLESYWIEGEFRMDTEDGRSIRIYLAPPEYLPRAWEAEAQGKVFKGITWEYRRVGQISPVNFELPDGLAPSP